MGVKRAVEGWQPVSIPDGDLVVLQRVPYFRTLTAEDLALLHRGCLLRRLEAGQTVVLEGALPPVLYVVRSGSLCIYKTSRQGKEQVLRTVRPGETFNDVPVLDSGPSPASVRALVAGTSVWELQAARVLELVASNPPVALAVIQMLAGQLRYLVALVEDLSFRHIVERVARLILEEGANANGRVDLTQQEMAARVGTAREVVSRALRELERRGAITRERHRIVDFDATRLRAILDSMGPTAEQL
jgi:CRP/FNR family cyclic AMP-dependent transcriptional regulator